VVDAEKVRDLIDDIRINLPTEIKNAQTIVMDRAEIMEVAKREGEQIIRKAEERAKALIVQEEIIKASQSKASDILTQTQMKSREMRHAASEFSDNLLKETEESLTKALTDVRTTRQALRSSVKRK
jgi:cell division septum initiation protein DivIVA